MNSSLSQIILKPGRDTSVRRFHPWIFSGAIAQSAKDLNAGDLVQVCASNKEVLGVGHYSTGSIAIKIISFGRGNIGPEFWTEKFSSAFRLRQTLGLTDSADTNCYRLINAEGDGLPGLIVDIYGKTAVVQAQSEGMDRSSAQVTEALQEVFKSHLANIYFKQYLKGGAEGQGRYALGSQDFSPVIESGNKFLVDWEAGQKTGFFLDQRDNRALAAKFAPGKDLLNLFCYTGGFSIYALAAGAKSVVSVDSSERAISMLEKNIELNDFHGTHSSHAQDCFKFLAESQQKFDVVIVDPPAFVKHRDSIKSGLKGYTDLNAKSLRAVKPGGIMLTFSCSQLVDEESFLRAVSIAGQQNNSTLKMIYKMRSAPCHPVSPYHPEGHYLKGFVFEVSQPLA